MSTAAAAVLYFCSAIALAEGKAERLSGVVYAIDGSTFTIAPEGSDETAVVRIGGGTKFLRDRHAASLKDVAVGQRVTVEGVRRNGALLAAVVMLPHTDLGPDGG